MPASPTVAQLLELNEFFSDTEIAKARETHRRLVAAAQAGAEDATLRWWATHEDRPPPFVSWQGKTVRQPTRAEVAMARPYLDLTLLADVLP